MSHVDDGRLNALLDGELDVKEAEAVRAHIAECTECARRLEEAKQFLAGASDLLGALDLPPTVSAPAAAPSPSPPAAQPSVAVAPAPPAASPMPKPVPKTLDIPL